MRYFVHLRIITAHVYIFRLHTRVYKFVAGRQQCIQRSKYICPGSQLSFDRHAWYMHVGVLEPHGMRATPKNE